MPVGLLSRRQWSLTASGMCVASHPPLRRTAQRGSNGRELPDFTAPDARGHVTKFDEDSKVN